MKPEFELAKKANEMLAALKDIASYADPAFGDYANALAFKARDAVAKAEGRSVV